MPTPIAPMSITRKARMRWACPMRRRGFRLDPATPNISQSGGGFTRRLGCPETRSEPRYRQTRSGAAWHQAIDQRCLTTAPGQTHQCRPAARFGQFRDCEGFGDGLALGHGAIPFGFQRPGRNQPATGLVCGTLYRRWPGRDRKPPVSEKMAGAGGGRKTERKGARARCLKYPKTRSAPPM